MIGPGSSCVIAQDIIIGGKVGFLVGERVTVEQIVPHAQRPEFKFVVLSTALNQRFQLREEDFVVTSKPTVTSQPKETTQPADEPKSTNVAKTIKGLFAFAFFVLTLVLGGIWWGWWGILIGFLVWAVIWGWWLIIRDISDMGEAARKQMKKDE